MSRFEKAVERIVASRMTLSFIPRDLRIPSDVAVETIIPEGSDLEVYAYYQHFESSPKYPPHDSLIGMAFAGKSTKPLWHLRFRDRAQLDKKIEAEVASRSAIVSEKQKRQQQRSEFQHTLEVGDILYSSWGYDQTNADFYQVVEVMGKSVKIREIAAKHVGEDSAVAVVGKFVGPPLLKRVAQGNSVRLNSYSSAYPWDGKPKYVTPFGMGH